MNDARRDQLLRALPYAVALAVCLPLLLRPRAIINADSYRAFDWLEAAKFNWYARHALLSEGLPAFWNPYLEGGIPSFGHPSDGTASPFFGVTMIFGEGLGMKINALLLLLLGTFGVAGLARDQLKLGPLPTAFAATAFAGAGWIPSRLAVGFYESLFLMVVPAVLWLVLRSAQRGPNAMGLAYAGGAGLVLASGGVQMQLCLAFAVLQGALWLPWAAMTEEADRRLPLLGFAVVAALLGAGLGAAKFVPMMDFLSSRGWRVEGPAPDPVGLWHAVDAAFLGLFQIADAVGEYGPNGDTSGWEYPYVGLGWAVLPLALLGAARSGRVGAAAGALAAVTLFLSWIPGTGAQVSLFPLVKVLPIFDAMRSTDRYVAFFLMLWLCLGAGLGVQALLRWERVPPGRGPLVVALLLLSLVPHAALAGKLNHEVFAHSAPEPAPWVETFYQVRTLPFPSRGSQTAALFVYLAPQAGVGVQYPPEDIRPELLAELEASHEQRQDGTLEAIPDYQGEAWFGTGSGTLGPLRPTVNRLTLEVHTQGPARIVINQNHHRAWVPSAGTLGEDRGLIAVDLDAAFDGELQLAFLPASVKIGGAVSAGSAVLFAGVWVLVRRREWVRP
ncbi:MAG: hypothetical protein GY898_25760 [Proteobacteria bacterium]|nr:hypothetical protein [Pseudomonadota bacterium]